MAENKCGALASISLGGIAAVTAVNFTHPIEVIKTRQQVMPAFSLRRMLHTEGLGAFFKGIQPAWCREALYSSVKVGGYVPIRDMLGRTFDAPVFNKLLAGCASGKKNVRRPFFKVAFAPGADVAQVPSGRFSATRSM